jgi:hypothetical protein
VCEVAGVGINARKRHRCDALCDVHTRIPAHQSQMGRFRTVRTFHQFGACNIRFLIPVVIVNRRCPGNIRKRIKELPNPALGPGIHDDEAGRRDPLDFLEGKQGNLILIDGQRLSDSRLSQTAPDGYVIGKQHRSHGKGAETVEVHVGVPDDECAGR